jgi:anti-sigma B factor antagonist
MASLTEVDRLQVRVLPDRDRVIVEVQGELDMAGVDAVQETLDELHAAGWNSLVLDLRGLTFIDSMGLGLLLTAERQARREGAAFAIVDGAPALARLLEVVGLEGHFPRTRVR